MLVRASGQTEGDLQSLLQEENHGTDSRGSKSCTLFIRYLPDLVERVSEASSASLKRPVIRIVGVRDILGRM